MKSHTHLAAICALLLLLAPSSRAVMMTYSYSQGGFVDDAFISGTFTVQDLNGDGVFAGVFPFGPNGYGETIGYFAMFSGNSIVPRFGGVSGLGIFGFFYNPATNDLVLSTESPVPGAFQDIRITHGLGSVTYGESFSPPFLSDASTGPVVVTLRAIDGVPVPETAETWCLLSVAMLALGLVGSRKLACR